MAGLQEDLPVDLLVDLCLAGLYLVALSVELLEYHSPPLKIEGEVYSIRICSIYLAVDRLVEGRQEVLHQVLCLVVLLDLVDLLVVVHVAVVLSVDPVRHRDSSLLGYL